MPETRLFDRAVIRLTPLEANEDVASFLQGLVTQDTKGPMPAWAGLLSPQGKALFDFVLWADGDDMLVDCEANQADALVRRLSTYRLRRKISIAVDPTIGVFWDLKQILGDGGGQVAVSHDPRHAALGRRWLAPVSASDTDSSEAFREHRLTLGISEGVAELGSDQTLWLEANAAELNGVSFSKGCYVGQENTARMNWRQKVNRRLVVVPISVADLKRQRVAYAQYGLSVELRRVEGMADLDLPDWQREAVNEVNSANETASPVSTEV
ncbi:MAG: folate-binding protein [Sphingorhabdus sp.]